MYTGEVDNKELERNGVLAYEDLSLANSNSTSHHQTVTTSHVSQDTNTDVELSSSIIDLNSSVSDNPSQKLCKALIHGHYEMQEIPSESALTNNRNDTDCKVNADIVVIPTDPVTGYSVLVRPDKVKQSSSQVEPYESIQISDPEPTFRKPRTDKVKQHQEKSSNLTARSLLQSIYRISSPEQSASRVPSPQDISRHTNCDVMSCDSTIPETEGYTLLRDGRPQLPSEHGPTYDTVYLPAVKIQRDKMKLETKYSDCSPGLTVSDPPVTVNSCSSHCLDCSDNSRASHYDTASHGRVFQTVHSSGAVQNVPTDAETGYSNMIRPEKFYPLPGPIPAYNKIKVKLDDDDSKMKSQNDNTSSVPAGELSQSPPSTAQNVPTNAETGYSSMIRPEKFYPLPGPIPAYNKITVKLDDGDSQMKTKNNNTSSVPAGDLSLSPPCTVLRTSSSDNVVDSHISD